MPPASLQACTVLVLTSENSSRLAARSHTGPSDHLKPSASTSITASGATSWSRRGSRLSIFPIVRRSAPAA
jgi:hypothetical protein